MRLNASGALTLILLWSNRKLAEKRNQFDRIIDEFGAILLFLILMSTFYQVVSRYFLNFPLSWSEEVSRYLLIWMAMIGSAMALRKNEHVFIQTFVNRLSPARRKIVRYLNYFVISSVLSVILYYGFTFAVFNRTQYSASIHWLSLFWACIALPLGAALMLVYVIIEFFVDVSAKTKKDPRG